MPDGDTAADPGAVTLDDIRAEMAPGALVLLEAAIQAAVNTKLRRALSAAVNAQNARAVDE